jgi:transcriptional regulator with XRE-family HTH domain
MIRNETEYENTVKQLREQAERLRMQRAELAAMDLGPEEIRRAMAPVRSFHEQLKEEVKSYERLKRGEFDELRNFQGLGQLLVALRLARRQSQRQLAERLGVHESQVSRDERNEYHGITVERAQRVLEALGAEVRVTVAKLSDELTASSLERVLKFIFRFFQPPQHEAGHADIYECFA